MAALGWGELVLVSDVDAMRLLLLFVYHKREGIFWLLRIGVSSVYHGSELGSLFHFFFIEKSMEDGDCAKVRFGIGGWAGRYNNYLIPPPPPPGGSE